jgi:hypothetical protein
MKIIPDPFLNSGEVKEKVKSLVKERSHFLPMLSVGADNEKSIQKVSHLSITFGHYVYQLGPGDLGRFPALPAENRFRFLLIEEDETVIATADFFLEKKKIRFSHFTSGPPADTFVSYLMHIEHYPKYSSLQAGLTYLKIPFLSTNAIKLSSGKRSFYIRCPQEPRNGILALSSEPEFIRWLHSQHARQVQGK